MAIEYIYEKQINNADVHRDVDRQQQKEYGMLTMLAAFFVVGLMFYGWQQYRWIQSGYAIESAQKKKESLTEYRNQLLLERASLSRDERVDNIARIDLKMVLPVAGQIVMLAPDAPTTIPVAPLPENPALAANK